MRKSLFGILSALTVCGCNTFDNELTVTDKGFEVAADVVWNSDHMAYTLNLHLDSGDEGRYRFNYLIDEDHTLKLLTDDDREFESGSETTLSRSTAGIYILPSLAVTQHHSMRLEFERDGVRRIYNILLPDTSQKAIGVKVDADVRLDFSRVILTNLMGASVTDYTVSFSLDGSPLKDIKYMNNTFGGSMSIDFARSESYTFELPYIIAGPHVITVNVKSNMGSESTGVGFTEPQRRQTDLKLSYNHYTGNLMISSDYNPLNTEFDISIGIEVKGKNTHRPKRFFGISDPETTIHSDKAESSISIVPGITPKPIDGGLLKQLMDNINSIEFDDAANAIGNGNKRRLATYIYEVTLRFGIHSKGDYAGETYVAISPVIGSEFPILYKYPRETWYCPAGASRTISPAFTVNDSAPGDIRKL